MKSIHGTELISGSGRWNKNLGLDSFAVDIASPTLYLIAVIRIYFTFIVVK
jgi:hypothetical protein